MHDLLSDPMIGVRTTNGVLRLCLPELLAALSAGQVEGYTGLRAHQADPWHVFLVQLAASIQSRRPTDTLPSEAGYWREGLLDLADGISEAWHLVVDDVTKPAFLQHPWKSWDEDATAYGVKTSRGKTVFDAKARSPDKLDVLVTSKNHDVKMARVGPDAVEAWLYALVILQTTSGILGRGNYGIVRMNSGTGSRCIVAWTQSLSPSSRFIDEVGALAEMRASVCEAYRYPQRGIVLSWTTRWNRESHHLQLSQLEPWFIETARLIRLRAALDGSLLALGVTSKARQIGPKTIDNGDVGDPWTPIKIGDKKKGVSALTLSADGFTPQRLTDLLFEQGFKLTPLQKSRAGNTPGWFVGSCLVRGEGTTEGFHRVEIPVPAKARMALVRKETRDTLSQLAHRLLVDAREVQKAVGTALTVLTEGGADKPDYERVEKWIRAARLQFVKQWEQHFFPTLWRGAEEQHDKVRADWQQRLADAGQDLLEEAHTRLPLPANRLWRSLAKSRGAYRGMLNKGGLPMPGRPGVASIEPMEDVV